MSVTFFALLAAMSGLPVTSFLRDFFNVPVPAADHELHRLQLENASLKSRLRAAEDSFRNLDTTLKKLLAQLQIVTQRAVTNVVKPGAADPTHEIYNRTSLLRSEPPSLKSLQGRQVVIGVVKIMTDHFFMMLKHVEFACAPLCSMPAGRDELMKTLLSQLLIWVFGINVDIHSEFCKRPLGAEREEEVSQILMACIALRRLVECDKEFPVQILMSFIINWNAFVQHHVGTQPLPVDPKLGLSAAMTVMEFDSNIECRCDIYVAPCENGGGTLRMFPKNSSVLQNRKRHGGGVTVPRMRRTSSSSNCYLAAATAATALTASASASATAPAAAAAAAAAAATAPAAASTLD